MEELAKQIFAECERDGEPITMEEAMEMAEMEIKARGVKNYTQTEAKQGKKTRERKVDSEKAEILEYIAKGLTLLVNSTTITRENETKLHFTYNGSEYSVNLIKHRPPKK